MGINLPEHLFQELNRSGGKKVQLNIVVFAYFVHVKMGIQNQMKRSHLLMTNNLKQTRTSMKSLDIISWNVLHCLLHTCMLTQVYFIFI